MIEVVVAMDEVTKNIYYLSPNSLELNINDEVIFESEFGLINGIIIKGKYLEKKKNLVLPLFNVKRLVSNQDRKIIKGEPL